MRSDLEIFDGSVTLGTIPVGTIIPRKDVLDRRVKPCGVVRFRARCDEFGGGSLLEFKVVLKSSSSSRWAQLPTEKKSAKLLC